MLISEEILQQTATPALLVNMEMFDFNVQAMQAFARRHRLKLRPHAKTVRSTALVKKMLQAGAAGVTVAKLEHARILAKAGVDSIFIANMIVGDKINRLLSVSRMCPYLASGVDNLEASRAIGRVFAAEKRSHYVLVKIDTGLGRTGIQPKDAVSFISLLREVPGLTFAGIYTHAGHAYSAQAKDIEDIGRSEGTIMVNIKRSLAQAGIVCPTVSVGSTPTVKYSGAVSGVTEIRPGLYVFNDRVQVSLGIVPERRCALVVLATVVSKQDNQRAVIDAGSQVFSADRGPHGSTAIAGFGQVLGCPQVELFNLSEEHGWLRGPGVAELKIGDKLQIIPNHACATVNLANKLIGIRRGDLEEYFTVDGRGAVL